MPNSLSVALLKRPAVLIPLGLFLFAFLFRLVGIGWGLKNEFHNQSYHPDEIVNFQVANRVNLGAGEVTPGFYNYGTAYFYVYSVACKMVSAYGGGPKENDPASYWDYMRRCELAGRVISSLAGAGIVVVVWLICRRLTTLTGSLFGAGLACFAPGIVVHSRFATVDVFAVFFLALSALFALRILGNQPGSLAEGDPEGKRSDMKDAVLSGLFAGISTGTKYTGILVLLILFAVLAIQRKPDWWQQALAAVGTCFFAFFFTTPGVLLDSQRFWTDFNFELGHSASGHGLIFVGTSNGFLYHLGNIMVGIGFMALVASVFSLVYGMYRRHPWAFALSVFFLVYYLAIGRAEVKFMRYVFPLIVPMAIAFGYGLGTAFRENTKRGRFCIIAGIFALSGNPFFDFGGLIGAARYTQAMIGNDPRDEAYMYLKQNGVGKTVGIVKDPWFWSVPVVPDAGSTRDKVPLIYEELALTENPKVVRYLPGGSLEGRQDWDVRLLDEQSPDYVIYSSFESVDDERIAANRPRDAVGNPVSSYLLFQNKLRSSYELVTGFGGLVPEIHDLMYIHPTVYVWKKKSAK